MSQQAEKCIELCTSQTDILLANQTRGLGSLQADGIMGLSPSGSERILRNLFEQEQIKNKMFSFSLDKNVFTLGGYDVKRFTRPGQ